MTRTSKRLTVLVGLALAAIAGIILLLPRLYWLMPATYRESLVSGFVNLASSEPRLGGERPTRVYLPKQYNSQRTWPLLLVLHGFKSSPAEIEMYLKPRRLADKFGYVLLLPHGNLNQNGNYYWNATKDCCAYDSAAIDDSSYLLSLVKEAIDRYAIDPQRVYGIGFSNGGYMMYRLACEDKGLFKGMGIIAGLSFKDPRACTQPTPRTIVHIHGTADEIVPVDAHNREASTLTPLLKRWSERNGCPNASPARRSRLNLTKSVEGPDTDHLVWHDCQEAGLHYFQINDASHTPWYHQSPIHQIWPLLDQKSTTEQPTNRATTQSEAR